MNKKLFFGIILVIVSSVARFLYASYQPQPLLNADSYGYYGFGKKIVENPSLSTFINQYRVPVYFTLLGGLMVLNNKTDIPLDAPGFRPVLDQLTFFQSAFGVMSMLFIYLLLLRLSIPVVWAFGVSLFLSLNVYVYPLERAVMTDSLAGTFLIGLTYLLVRLVLKPTVRGYVLFAVLSAMSWLLRPNLLLVPVLSLPLLLLVKTNSRYIRTNLVVFGISLLLPVIFVFLNFRFHGYTGISQINEINLLGRILEFNVPVEAGKEYTKYYNAVQDYRLKNGEPMPYRFIDAYAPLTYVDTQLMGELQKFDRAVIAASLPSYIIQAISYIPKIFSDDPPLLTIDTRVSGGLPGFFALLWQVYRGIWYVGYLVFILWPVSVWLYFKKPSGARLIPVLLGTISISQLLVIVFFDYYDAGQYARLASVIQPQTYLFIIHAMRMSVLKANRVD